MSEFLEDGLLVYDLIRRGATCRHMDGKDQRHREYILGNTNAPAESRGAAIIAGEAKNYPCTELFTSPPDI